MSNNGIGNWKWHEKAQGWVCSAGGYAVLVRRPIEAGPPSQKVTLEYVQEVMRVQERRKEREEESEYRPMSDEEFSANWGALLDTLSPEHIKHIYEAVHL